MAKLVFDEIEKRTGRFGLDNGVVFIRDKAYPWNGLIDISESTSPLDMGYIYLDGQRINLTKTPGALSYSISAYTYPSELDVCLGRASNRYGLVVEEQNYDPCHIVWKSYILDAAGNQFTIFNILYNVHLSFRDTFSNKTKTTVTELETIDFVAYTLPIDIPGYKPTSRVSIDSRIGGEQVAEVMESMLYGTSTTDPYLPNGSDIVRVLTAANKYDIGPESSVNGLYTLIDGTSLSGSTAEGIFEILNKQKLVETTTPGVYEVK